MSRPKPPFPTLNRSHPLAKGLIGAWAFSEGSGDKLYDLSGNGNHGTLTNMDPSTDWVAGQHGWALDFDGTDDAVVVADSPSLTPPNGLSVVTLLKRGLTATREWLVNKAAGSIATNAYIVEINSSNQLRNAVSNGSSQGTAIHTDLLLDSTNRWYHAVLTWDGATVRGYLDGVLSSVSASVSGPLNDDGNALRFSRAALPTLPFAGRMASALLYDRALSPAEVGQLYHDPFALYRRRRLWVTVSTNVFTGTAAPSTGAASTSAIGDTSAVGDGSVATGGLTTAASGTFTAPVFTGAGEAATGGVATAASGDTTAVGTSSVTVGAATADASGDLVGFIGSGQVSIPAAASQAAGDTTAIGSGVVTLGPTTVVASGTAGGQEFTGAAAVTTGAASLAGTGILSAADFNPQGEIFARPLLLGTIYALD